MAIDLSEYKYFLIVDLEATCCDQQSIPREEMETIEIGAVMVDADTLSITDEYQTFIKPVRHPTLTKFCIELTSITQADVDNAPAYAAAVTTFKRWLNKYQNFVFYSWGQYDKNQFRQDSEFHQIAPPIDAEHVNLKNVFSQAQGLRKSYGMARALRLAKVELDGIHHRGIDDARNMVKLLPYALGRKHLKLN
jgi:inhibitor of KinA sporulation pathway (predicted exonuclease)